VFEYNTQILEIDIHLSRDGHLVLHHDGVVEATTNGQGPISGMTLDQIRQFDAGHLFTMDGGATYPLRGQGHTIPTLNEVLDEFLPVDNLVFFFDMKDKNAIGPTLKVIEDRNISDRVIFGAVSPDINARLLEVKPPNIPIAADFSTMMTVYRTFLTGGFKDLHLRHDILGFIVDDRTKHLLTPQLFEAFHARGKWIAVFGELLNDPAMQKWMVDLKADIIFSDRPDILRQTLGTRT